MDYITITGLTVFAHHGVYEEETKNGQDFVVNAKLYLDTKEAGDTDDLIKSVHYGDVCELITNFMQEHTYLLIERVAEQTALEVLHQYPLLKGIELEICKPQAPIMLPFTNVSVTIKRMWHTAYIALGSNMGDKEAYIKEAVRKLNEHRECKVYQVSSFIKTEPYGGVEQDDFVNSALKLETLLTPEDLLKLLNKIEKEAGRERTIHWGPRTLDLDIIFYDNEIIDTESLHIPHMDMQNRDFVLIPLNELAPYYRHPLNKKTVSEMLAELNARGGINVKS